MCSAQFRLQNASKHNTWTAKTRVRTFTKRRIVLIVISLRELQQKELRKMGVSKDSAVTAFKRHVHMGTHHKNEENGHKNLNQRRSLVAELEQERKRMESVRGLHAERSAERRISIARKRRFVTTQRAQEAKAKGTNNRKRGVTEGDGTYEDHKVLLGQEAKLMPPFGTTTDFAACHCERYTLKR